jgi:outer membrane protein assembly factor BamB
MAALDGQTGAVLWKTLLTNIYGMIQSSPAVANGVVYIATGDSKIFALNATSGAVQWTYIDPVGTPFIVAPAVANGVLYTGSVYGQFLALDAKTGKVLWSYEPQGEVDCSPVVVNGTLYIGANDGFLYKFALS